MRNAAARPDYLPYIDGLRAVAVLAVVAYHLNAAWLPGGFTGVDIFFVISGFVVSASVDRLEPAGTGASLLRFYARRLRRIAPALIVCLLVTCVASGLFIPQAWLSDTSRETGRMAFFGLSNWVLAGTGSDYFSPKVEFNPFTHTWSLGVEEQFYLVFPFLFLGWTRGRRGRGWSLLLFAAALVSSLGYAWWLSKAGGREVEGFYLTTSRFWQLAAGVVLYQGLVRSGAMAGSGGSTPPGRQRRQWLRNSGIALSAGLIIAGLVLARPGHSPWPDGLWPVLGTVGLLALVYDAQSGWMGRMLSWSPVVAIGRISYSLYLWHWPVFVLFRWTVGLEATATRAAALALAFALAIASYRWVERPLRHSPRLVRMRDWRFVTAAVLVVVVSGSVYRHVARHQDDYSLSVVTRNARDWYPSGEKLDGQYPGCHLQPRNVQVQGNVAWVYERSGGCDKPVVDSRRIFVAGDSHAVGYSEMLQRLAYESGRPVTLYAVGGCPLASLQAGHQQSPDCQAYADAALADVMANARAGDVLFLPGLRLPRLSEQWLLFDERQAKEQVFGAAAAQARAAGIVAAVARLKPLAERGVSIVLEAPKPVLRSPPYRCSDWFNRDNPICTRGLQVERPFLEEFRAPALTTLKQITSELPGASVWDPFPLLCPGVTCSAMDRQRPLFFDGDHLSGHGNRKLLPDFSAHLQALPAPVAGGASAPAQSGT